MATDHRGYVKDPLTLTVMHFALFILSSPDFGRDPSRGKLQPLISRKK